ncbi:hypothetical protein LV779_36980 [Streptomyces thinghirensis]|nr:hypothetical protein [Streptomyces thinghirensis]
MAIAAGAPLVSLNDGAGARIQEGVSALAGYGGIFQQHQGVRVILQIKGGCSARAPAAPPTAPPSRTSSSWSATPRRCSSPDRRRRVAVTGEEITQNGLGGARRARRDVRRPATSPTTTRA